MRVSLRRAATVLAAAIALAAQVLPTASAAPTIPTPEQYFGFRIGTDGRLAMLTISSKRNLDNLDRLVKINQRLADPRGLSEADAERLAHEGKPFYYVQAGIHSNEVGNSQAMLEIAHRLATAGTGAPRMFTPPYLSPYDPNIDPITVQQTNDMGMAMQRGTTSADMKGVGWAQSYDYWTPSRQYQVYHGAARLLTEAASVSNLAYPQVGDGPLGQQESDINFLEPYDSNTWRLRQIVDYTSQTFYSGVDELANDGYNWLRDFSRVGVKHSTRSAPYAFVIPAGQRDPRTASSTRRARTSSTCDSRTPAGPRHCWRSSTTRCCFSIRAARRSGRTT